MDDSDGNDGRLGSGIPTGRPSLRRRRKMRREKKETKKQPASGAHFETPAVPSKRSPSLFFKMALTLPTEVQTTSTVGLVLGVVYLVAGAL
jgi:hypothetical protein